jgi:DNA-binding NarL/FixJ family response regulator
MSSIPEEVTILLVEPSPIVREGLRLLLEGRAGFVVVGEAGDGRRAVEMAERLSPDVVVTELMLPRLSGLEVARQILKGASDSRVLVLSGRDTRSGVEEALRIGVTGFVLKSASPKELIEGIEVVHAGDSFLSPTVTHYVVDAIAHPGGAAPGSLSRLTSREREVLQLIAEGYSSKEVAGLMQVSLKTVESHRSSLMSKLGIHKVASLVRFAIREGLLEA